MGFGPGAVPDTARLTAPTFLGGRVPGCTGWRAGGPRGRDGREAGTFTGCCTGCDVFRDGTDRGATGAATGFDQALTFGAFTTEPDDGIRAVPLLSSLASFPASSNAVKICFRETFSHGFRFPNLANVRSFRRSSAASSCH